MDKQNKNHRRSVDKLANRLSSKNYYDVVLKNPTYEVNGLEGELDVLAIRGRIAHYYEIKTNDTTSAYYKAIEQINRVQMAFPMWNVRGIYVPMNGRIARIE